MPYITCKDGKTYSRYDQSEYVKKCICEEKEAQEREFKECMQDPACKKDYENKQFVSKTIAGVGIALFAILIIFAVRAFIKMEIYRE